ncbi:MAG: class I SAM-dependent methyltransferase, partial [Gemmataceae bacterium]|nr:class I SAM-dependent methyltransferase [Gemmataceae bacterium]
GTGFLAYKLASHCPSVVGIDLSDVSIQIARSYCPSHGPVQFLRSSVEEFAQSNSGQRFPVIVANMALQTAPDLDASIAAMAALATEGAVLVVTLPHPWFWPEYWGYASAPWFSYGREIAIEAPLRISKNKEPSGITTHIHRPLDRYVTSFFRHRFVTEVIREPVPPKDVQKLYPQPWDLPRFLGMRLRFRSGRFDALHT